MKSILTLATVAFLGTTGLVAAQESGTAVDAFSLPQAQRDDGVIELGTVTAQADGVIEIYDAGDTEMATILGSEPVTAGANTDVKVTLTTQPISDVVAVLRVNGEVVAQETIELDRGDDPNNGDDGSGDGNGDNEGGEGGEGGDSLGG